MSDERTPPDGNLPPEATGAPTPAESPRRAGGADDAPSISIDRFQEIELRVGRVVAAEKVDKADRLLKLRVDLGDHERQIVAGIALAYDPGALVGKRIVVVANLRPARIRGIESQGMLLAADLGGRPIVATFDEEVPAGTRVR